MSSQAAAAYIPGSGGITVAGVNDDGTPILLEIDPHAAAALSRQLERATGDMIAYQARQPRAHHTTDEPLSDLVGRQGE